MRIADYLMARLAEVGVETIFTVTGRGSLHLTDALAKNPNLKHLSTHHE
jgi:acetolactate synthase-1/2/3 large subunit